MRDCTNSVQLLLLFAWYNYCIGSKLNWCTSHSREYSRMQVRAFADARADARTSTRTRIRSRVIVRIHNYYSQSHMPLASFFNLPLDGTVLAIAVRAYLYCFQVLFSRDCMCQQLMQLRVPLHAHADRNACPLKLLLLTYIVA